MDPQRLHDQLRDVFRRILDDEALEIRDDMAAGEVEGWDSLAQMNLVAGVEERFQVRFQTAEIRALRNVGEFKRVISGKLAA